MPIILKNNSGPVILDGVNVSELVELVRQAKEFTEILDWYLEYQRNSHAFTYSMAIEPFHNMNGKDLLKLLQFISQLSKI